MSTTAYFRSLGDELHSLEYRIDNFIHPEGSDYRHWLTIGESREALLRTVLSRHISHNVGVGSGFVITPDGPTNQIDILLYDKNKPVLYSNGNVVLLTPGACLGMIEVKKKITRFELREVIDKMFRNQSLVQTHLPLRNSGLYNNRPMCGIFSYEYDSHELDEEIPLRIKNNAENGLGMIDVMALGDNIFTRFFNAYSKKKFSTESRVRGELKTYELYEMAKAYFIFNVVTMLGYDEHSDETENWFPREGKEPYRKLKYSINSPNQ